ncbi:MAG: ABC transporter permease subunit, partial [Bacteroidota bacterium]
AATFGIIIGLLTGRIAMLRASLEQIIQAVRAVPAISFVPLAIIWFGIGEPAKQFLVAWGAFFPIWLNTHVGATNVDRDYLWAAESLGASKTRILATVILPAALPFISAGLRIGIAMGFICLVAAEMAGAYEGLGFRVTASHLVFRVDKMFVALTVLGVLSAVVDKLFSVAWFRLFPWMRVGRSA